MRTAWFVHFGYSSSLAWNPWSWSSNMNVNFTSGSQVRDGGNFGCHTSFTGPGTSQHTTKQAKLCFKPRTLSFSIYPSALPPFCLYYSPLCSSSCFSLSLCVGVSLISTFLFGAPLIVIAWIPENPDLLWYDFIVGSQVLHDEFCLLPLSFSLSLYHQPGTSNPCIRSGIKPGLFFTATTYCVGDNDRLQLWITQSSRIDQQSLIHIKWIKTTSSFETQRQASVTTF